jgi:hypothetical protein
LTEPRFPQSVAAHDIASNRTRLAFLDTNYIDYDPDALNRIWNPRERRDDRARGLQAGFSGFKSKTELPEGAWNQSERVELSDIARARSAFPLRIPR